MSISRKNWSALSSLARQWTMEDEEEVERERRRRVKSSSSSSDSSTPSPHLSSSTPSSNDGTGSDPKHEETSSVEQLQLDFVEMLRVRDEKRRVRLVETLRKQKAEEEEEEEEKREPVVSKRNERRGVTESKVEVRGNTNEEQDMVFAPEQTTSTQGPASKGSGSDDAKVNGESLRKDPDTNAKSSRTRSFVSSVSISLDKGPSSSGRTTPMSPGSPNIPLSPKQFSPCQSPPPGGPKNPVENGHTEESLHKNSFEQTSKPAFIRQSSRTLSFRMMKKEDDVSPLQRSSSVRVATKRFENNTAENDEEKITPFARNSKQRLSSRSIQEKLERLAQAAQKSEMSRPTDVSHRTLPRLDEVSRKRGLFEREEPQKASSGSPAAPRRDFRTLTSGMSQGINQWMNKNSQSGSFASVSELRNVNINSKRSLFENRDEGDGGVSNNTRTVHVFK